MKEENSTDSENQLESMIQRKQTENKILARMIEKLKKQNSKHNQ